MIVRLLVKMVIVLLVDIGIIGLARTRDNFSSDCIGKVRQIFGGGAWKVIGRE